MQLVLEWPPYIPLARVASAQLYYSWDDEDPYGCVAWPDEDVKTCLRRVSNRGVAAYAVGCGEWVLCRLSRHLQNDLPYRYLEVFWALILGANVLLPPEPAHEEWRGPVNGPIDLCLSSILNVFCASAYGPPVQDAALVAQVANHVLADKWIFSEWQDRVLSRLAQFAPRSEQNVDGGPVPRQILDPGVDLTRLDAQDLIASSLTGLSPVLLRV